MKSIGLLIMLDNIMNRVMANRRRGKYTRVYIDEAHLLFKNPYSAEFLLKAWKRFRKYGGLLTGITQNIKLKSITGQRLYPKNAAVKKLLREKEEAWTQQKADTEAAESAAQTAADKVYQGGRAVVENRIHKHRAKRIKMRESYTRQQQQRYSSTTQKQNANTPQKQAPNPRKSIKTRERVSAKQTSRVKTGNAYSKTAGTDDNTAQDVVVIDEAKKQKLKTVFWDMHTITSRTEVVTVGELTRIILYITIDAKTKDEMILKYFFGTKQKEALETLLENSDAFTGTMQSLAVSDATARAVIESLPEDLSEERKLIVKKACSLVGKVTYFWGGKSSAIGWDSEWGKMKTSNC